MPKIECWDNLPEGVRQHLIDRMRDRAISIADLNQLRVWIESKPEVPEGDWYTRGSLPGSVALPFKNHLLSRFIFREKTISRDPRS